MFERFPNAIAAETCASFLRYREIEVRVEHADPLATAMGTLPRVVVLAKDERRARFVLESSELTDTEAWLLATGELDPAAAKVAFARDRGAATALMRRGAGLAGVVAVALLIASVLISR